MIAAIAPDEAFPAACEHMLSDRRRETRHIEMTGMPELGSNSIFDPLPDQLLGVLQYGSLKGAFPTAS